jgi:hypothetical protein
MGKQKTLKQRCIEDKDGNVVFGQAPNLPLKVAASGFVIGLFLTTGTVSEFIDVLTFGAFFTWSWLELFQGVNYLRRAYGLLAIILLFSIRLF